MDLDFIRSTCLSLPQATEQVQWENQLVFKVGGKMFALAPLEAASHLVSFKCSPERFAELIERPGVVPAPYLARAHWIALEPDHDLSPPELRQCLRDSHALVFARLPKSRQAKLAKRR